MSVPASLLPADARSGVGAQRRVGTNGPGRELDRLHDHVLRVLGDRPATSRVVADVAARSAARAHELGESPTFATMVRLAHARLASTTATRPDDALVAELAGEREPGGGPLVRALAATSRTGAALVDLTTRHDLELRQAASLLGVERAAATRARTEALQQVRSALTGVGLALDVGATLSRLPVVGAPAWVHTTAEFPDPTNRRGPLPAPLAWAGTAAAIVATVAGVTFGMPSLVSADIGGNAPVVVAEGVTEGPAARQLATPGDDVPKGGVEQLVVRAPADQPTSSVTSDEPEPAAPSPEPTPSPEPSPTEDAPSPEPEDDEPNEEPSPEPSPEPSEDPLEELLPTDP